jgi:uncharacterized membrane protein YphA (DoxX/SURF4 family)
MTASRQSDTQAAALVLRLGLAFIFAYAGIASFFQPLEWTGYLPSFITNVVSATVAVQLMALIEVALAVWLVSGVCLFYAAIASTVLLAGITAVNINLLVITFRDVGLVCAALALVLLTRKRK